MEKELRILLIEDLVTDAELVERELSRSGLRFVLSRVETREALESALDGGLPDVVLSDHGLPNFDGLAALRLIRQRSDSLPFIFVTGSMGEEAAVEALRGGATDYILKDRLARLPAALKRALRESESAAERLKAERRKADLEDELRQAHKMEAMGRLAGGVAHDFNNILTAIGGFGDLLLARLKEDDPLRMYVKEILSAGERAAGLTRQLMAFSRKQVLQPSVLDLNGVVGALEPMLRRLIGENVELRVVPAPALGRVKADRGQVEQIIMNLVLNARDAMPQGGQLAIETADVDLDADHFHEFKVERPGPYVMLAVSDTGQGMDEETRSHLFEPFFTTKRDGKGTGLGLSTVYGVVKQSEGYIWVYSELGRGTVFKIYLPRTEAPAERTAGDAAVARSLRGSEVILVVEDSEVIRRLACEVLRLSGYTVLHAPGGGEGLAMAEQHDGRIDLLLTDVVMPKMSGRELAARLLPSRPKTKVLYMSGYTADAISHDGVLDAGVALIEKPFSPTSLLAKVREVLDGKGDSRP